MVSKGFFYQYQLVFLPLYMLFALWGTFHFHDCPPPSLWQAPTRFKMCFKEELLCETCLGSQIHRPRPSQGSASRLSGHTSVSQQAAFPVLSTHPSSLTSFPSPRSYYAQIL